MSLPNANREIFNGLRPAFEERIAAINGMQLPDDLDQHLIDLLAEIGVWIPRLEFTKTQEAKLADITFSYNQPPQVKFNASRDLDPREWGEHDAKATRTCALLHEIMHAVCDSFYEKPPKELPHLRGVNFDISRALDSQPDAIANQMAGQRNVVLANLDNVKQVLSVDTNEAVALMKPYLTKKVDYGEGTPDVHYDPILFELLLYISLTNPKYNPNQIPTFKYVKALSREAAARRIAPEIRRVEAGPSVRVFLESL